MAHYKNSRGRLAERTSATPEEWYGRCAEIGRLVNKWAGRSDLAVYGGEDSAGYQSVACFIAESAEIEVNVEKVFKGANPEFVGNLLDEKVWLENPYAMGILYHEACHAKHSANWNMGKLKELEPAVRNAFMLLEESRIEVRGAYENPDMVKFLKVSALEFVLEGVNEASIRQHGEVWATANTLGLIAGRLKVGILSEYDLPSVIPAIKHVLSPELYKNLSEIVYEFSSISVNNMNRGVELATKWVELLREADPEGEGNQGELTEGEESELAQSDSQSGGQSGKMSKVLSEIAEQIAEAIGNMEELAERMAEIEAERSEAEQRSQSAKERNQRKELARVIFDKRYDKSGSGTSSRVTNTRTPQPVERAMAVKLGQSLEKAKYRERSLTEVYSHTPVGRLNVRRAIQNKALESRGVRGTNPAWERKVRKHTDEPILRLGIMVDISGSMTNAMEAMAQTAWILSEAGRRIQAKTAMVYFGAGVFPTLRVGERLDSVTTYSATDPTEEFAKAWQATDGLLGLTWQDGVKMLVIVSDGQYRPEQFDYAVKTLKECKANGVAVVIVSPTGTYNSQARNLIAQSGWGTLVTDIPDSEIPNAIGKAVTASMKTLERT